MFLAHFLAGGRHAVREGVNRPRAPPDFAAMRSMELPVQMRSQCSCWKPTYMILCLVKPEAELGQARRFSSSGAAIVSDMTSPYAITTTA